MLHDARKQERNGESEERKLETIPKQRSQTHSIIITKLP